jgi:sugar lactone lactonase YvrE
MRNIVKSVSCLCAIYRRCRFRFGASTFVALAWLALSAAQAQTTNFTLGATIVVEGPTAGSNSIVLAVTPQTGGWTATANASWLRLSAESQSGSGSTNVVFEFDANPGATRSGTLTIAGQTLTVTQAGSTYVPSGAATALVSAGLSQPLGVAVDAAGNVYIADGQNNALYEWVAANNSVAVLVPSGLNEPYGLAVDGAGNVYIADYGDNTIKEWIAANSNVVTLVSSGLNNPTGVAVDAVGNVYIADGNNNAIKEWSPFNSNVVTLVSSGLSFSAGVAVDAAGNVYIADYENNAIKEWLAASSTVITLVSSGLNHPVGVAVDGSGNLYIADNGNNAIKEWTAANNSVAVLVSGLDGPFPVAVDGVGNVYFADTGNRMVKELPYVFVDPTPILESLSAGNDALVVLPARANLLPPFAPASDDSWLNITVIANGVLNFAFSSTSFSRTANIYLYDQIIPVTQGGPNYTLGTNALLIGPLAGLHSVVLAVGPPYATWTNTANDSWLHLSPANQAGEFSANVVFSCDANTGATRSGTLTIAGQTLTVTQAGSTFAQATEIATLVSSGLKDPIGVAVDGNGNVYIADTAITQSRSGRRPAKP